MGLLFFWFLCAIFAATANAQSPSPPEAFSQSIKALRSLVIATDTGVNYAQYNAKLVDAKTAVDEVQSGLTAKTQAEIKAIFELYETAGLVWTWRIHRPSKCTGGVCLYSRDDPFVDSLMKRYDWLRSTILQVAPGGIFLPEGRWDTGQAMSLLWLQAKQNIEVLQASGAQPAQPQVPPVPTAKGSLEERLRELKELRQKNLITPEEYYEKRGQLLKEF